MNLDFYQSLTEDQKLVDEGLEVSLGNYSRPQHPPWKKKVAIAVGVGVASGVTGGVLVSIALCGRLRVIHGSASLETLQALLPKGGVLRKPD